MRHKDVWVDSYRGITYEIVKWLDYEEKPIWNYYIFLILEQFEDQELAKKFWPRDKKQEKWYYTPYNKVPVIHYVDFHGGVTYYEKLSFPGGKKVVKIGCDYNHLWDQEISYRETGVEREAKNTIDHFLSRVNYLMRCCGDGRLAKEDEGVYKEERFYSKGYLEAKKEKEGDF